MRRLIFLLVFSSIFACKKTAGPQLQNSGLPKVVTNAISDLTHYSVVLSGKVIDSGSSHITEQGILIDTIPMPDVVKNLDKIVLVPKPDGSMQVDLTDIFVYNVYYIRAYAKNASGTAYGDQVIFSNLPEKVFTGDVTLTKQQQVVSFGAKHYTHINGSLTIRDSVSDLSPLASLSILDENLSIINTSLKNFTGLDSLQVIGGINSGDVTIQYNKSLVNFAGLGALETNNGYFEVTNNDALLNFNGLDNFLGTTDGGELYVGQNKALVSLDINKMQVVNGDLELIENPVLTELSFPSLRIINGLLWIENNPSLSNLGDLEALTRTGGISLTNDKSLSDITALQYLDTLTGPSASLVVSQLPKLVSLDAFRKITSVGSLYIEKCQALKTLNGLENLVVITTELELSNDSSIVDFTGFEKLTAIGSLSISQNPALQSLKGLETVIKINNPVRLGINIEGNNGLQTLSGLQNCSYLNGRLTIRSNAILTDFCALKNIVAGGINDIYYVNSNATNPTQADILANCQ